MAKKSTCERGKKRELLVEKHAARRREYKQIVKSSTDAEEIRKAQEMIQKLPLNSNPVRLKTRCQQCGRAHAVYSKFGLCRICLRQQLMAGNVTGGRKSSW